MSMATSMQNATTSERNRSILYFHWSQNYEPTLTLFSLTRKVFETRSRMFKTTYLNYAALLRTLPTEKNISGIRTSYAAIA